MIIGYMLHMILSLFTVGGSLDSLLSMFGGDNPWGLLTVSAQLLMCVLGGALLLPAGLLTWRQSKAGPAMHVIYAILAILESLLGPIGQIMNCPEMAGLQFVLWPIWGATLAMIYPVFLLIWFSRPNVKAETRLWR